MSAEGKGPQWDLFSRWPKESFDFMFRGMDVYNRTARSWMDAAQSAAKGKPEEVARACWENYAALSRDMLDLFSGFYKTLGVTLPGDKPAWMEAFSKMQSPTAGWVPPQQGLEDFIKLSKGWQEGYAKVFQVWMETLEKTAEAYNAGIEKKDPQAFWNSWVESSGKFAQAWAGFVTEQMKAFLEFWKKFSPEEKSAGKKSAGVKKGKE